MWLRRLESWLSVLRIHYRSTEVIHYKQYVKDVEQRYSKDYIQKYDYTATCTSQIIIQLTRKMTYNATQTTAPSQSNKTS